MMLTKFEKNDRVWHYEQRQPLTIIKVRKNRKTGEVAYILQSDNNELIEASPINLQYVPEIGDRVTVLLDPYVKWKQEEWKRKSWYEKQKTDIDELRYKAPEWLIESFNVRNIQADLAMLVGDQGSKITIPIYCLAVLEKRNKQQLQVAS